MTRALTAIKAEYNQNYKKLQASIGTPEHKKYVKIERELNRQEIKLRNYGAS